MPENQQPVTPAPSATSRKSTVIILVCLILACLAAAVFLFTSRSHDPEPAGDPYSLDGPDLFFMPGDFEPQELLILAGEDLSVRQPTLMSDIIRATGGHLAIVVAFDSPVGRTQITALMLESGLRYQDLNVLQMTHRSMWIRDFGPMTVSDDQGQRTLVDFAYRDRRGHRLDDGFPAIFSVAAELNLLGSKLRVEGGDILSNGRGYGLLSNSVVTRNADALGFGTEETLQNVAAVLGFEGLTLAPPLDGEATGHIDLYCAFLAPDLVVVGRYDEMVDPENARRLDQTAEILAGIPTKSGPMRVERMPMPDHEDGLWRTYTAIVFANDVVLVPVYPDYCPGLDVEALETYRRLLPERQIVGIDASDLVKVHGTLRSVTLNVPAKRVRPASPDSLVN